MPLIRQYRTFCDAAKIFACLCLVLLNFPGAGFALSYWDAIFELGFNPDEDRIDSHVACLQIERLIKIRNTLHAQPVFDLPLNTEIRQIESQISSLDAGNLYTQLPYADNIGVWRGIGIQGELSDDHYRLSIIDPAIENWVNSSPGDLPAVWGSYQSFGDFGLRAFVRPADTDRFRFETEGRIYIDDLNPSNMIRVVKQFANTAWLLAGDGTPAPRDFLEESALDAHSLKVIYGLARDFPSLFAVFNQYFAIDNVVAGGASAGSDALTFDIVIRINIDAIKKDYPYLGKLISQLKGAMSFKAILLDSRNRPLGTMEFDGDRYLFATKFKTRAGRFLVLTNGSDRKTERGVDLTVAGNQQFQMMYTFILNIVGLRLDIEALKVDLDYYYDANTAGITAGLGQTSEKISAEGLVLGFLPIWLIDLFIPSNIEDMTREFIQTLVAGNDGKGLSIMFGNLEKESPRGNLWLLTEAEVMSNGTLRLAFNLQRKIFSDDEKLSEDIRIFSQRLWKAFYLDFLRIKLLKSCQ